MTAKLLWAAGAAILATAPVSGATVFDNPVDFSGGDCVFNTTCGPVFTGNTFAGQLFTLASATTLTSGSFTIYTNQNTQPTAVNWLVLADGGAGLPGTLIASGNSAITSRTSVGTDLGYDVVKDGYALSGVTLGAGSYFIAVQAVSSEFRVYLAGASAFSGAVTTNDGGASFFSGYRGFNGVAVSLDGIGAVPEAATWAMMIAGFGLVGAAMRRRAAVAA